MFCQFTLLYCKAQCKNLNLQILCCIFTQGQFLSTLELRQSLLGLSTRAYLPSRDGLQIPTDFPPPPPSPSTPQTDYWTNSGNQILFQAFNSHFSFSGTLSHALYISCTFILLLFFFLNIHFLLLTWVTFSGKLFTTHCNPQYAKKQPWWITCMSNTANNFVESKFEYLNTLNGTLYLQDTSMNSLDQDL